jgi:hypothetical protein
MEAPIALFGIFRELLRLGESPSNTPSIRNNLAIGLKCAVFCLSRARG